MKRQPFRISCIHIRKHWTKRWNWSTLVLPRTLLKRYPNHARSFRNRNKKNATELSKHIWKLKDENSPHIINWKIIKYSKALLWYIMYLMSVASSALAIWNRSAVIKFRWSNSCFLSCVMPLCVRIEQHSIHSILYTLVSAVTIASITYFTYIHTYIFA